MPRTRIVLALARKEAQQIFRDPSSIFIAFVLPLILLLLFGYGVSLDLNDIKFGVAAEDGGAIASRAALEFSGSSVFSVTTAAARQDILDSVADGSLAGALVIPHGFSAALLGSGKLPAVQIVVDGVMPNTASLAGSYAMTVAERWLAAETGRRPAIEINSRVWYNEGAVSKFYIIPAMIVVVMSLTGTMLTSLVVAREWERGTMEMILSMPVRRSEIMAGKILPYYLLAILSTYVCVFFSTRFFGVPYRGSMLMLFCVGTVFMIASLSIGLIISNATKNQYAASIAALLLSFMPAIMLSGGVFELNSMPAFQQMAAACLPGKYLSSCMLTLFLVGDVPEILAPNMAVLALMGAAGLGVTYALTPSRIG